MKQRITYLLRNAQDQGGVDPATLQVKSDSLRIPGLDGAKEWRITVGASELPQEIWQVLKQSHELHIRWTSPRPYDAVSPLVSRTPPGLHVSFTPRKDATQDSLCPLLIKVFGDNLACHSVKESFTNPPILSERFAMSASHQYYQPLLDLQSLITYLQHKTCDAGNTDCKDQVAKLDAVSSLNLDFDVISHALQITAVWARGPSDAPWDETIRLQSKSDSIEVGVLNAEKPTEPEELSLGGFLTVLSEDDKPSATLFSFPSRHHPLPSTSLTTFTTSFLHPTGLHPTLQLSFPSTSSLTPPSPSCALHAYFALPSTVFLDRYQLSDPLFLASQNLVSLRSLSGESDLEAPDWVLKKWGSAALFQLASPVDFYDSEAIPNGGKEDGGSWNISIPLHLRYLDPHSSSSSSSSFLSSSSSGSVSRKSHRPTLIPHPSVFWACEAEDGLKMSVNPFDRVNLGYDGLFGPKTMFYHIPPSGPSSSSSSAGNVHGKITQGGTSSQGWLFEKLEAPVLDLDRAKHVELGTAVAVLVGFLWVGWRLFKAAAAATPSGKKENERAAAAAASSSSSSSSSSQGDKRE